MATLIEKLNTAIESKNAIKTAIINKGVTDVGDVLSTYADKIASIPVSSGSSESSSGVAKTIVDNYIKLNYTGGLVLSDDAVVGLKAIVNPVPNQTEPSKFTLHVTGYTGTDGVMNISDYKDYSSTKTYIQSIISSTVSSNYTFQDISVSYCWPSIEKALVVIPQYGVFVNLGDLATGPYLGNPSDMMAYLDSRNNSIYMFLSILLKENSNVVSLPLFAFDKYNQAQGGTAIDWSQVFPNSGVRYGDLT